MSVFIKVFSGEVYEAKQHVKEMKSKLLEVSSKTRSYLTSVDKYGKKLMRASNLLTELREDVFKVRAWLPSVPETIIPKSKTVIREFNKEHSEELTKLKKLIKDI
ncbi:MAG: hypothetical protein JSW08_03020 [archaeon]|nr:MAG: hypothetical protein JSW08_03020 [archaeon]